MWYTSLGDVESEIIRLWTSPPNRRNFSVLHGEDDRSVWSRARSRSTMYNALCASTSGVGFPIVGKSASWCFYVCISIQIIEPKPSFAYRDEPSLNFTSNKRRVARQSAQKLTDRVRCGSLSQVMLTSMFVATPTTRYSSKAFLKTLSASVRSSPRTTSLAMRGS
jgi:hypothetical protein